jgi:uncharacterized protein
MSATSRTDGFPLNDREIDELQHALDRVPPPLEPLDVSMLDGFLCGVLLQPQSVPSPAWLPFVTDAEGRALPRDFDARVLHTLAQRRHAELEQAIARRQWFDPWVFELESESEGGMPTHAAPGSNEADGAAPVIEAAYAWVAGFVTALEAFPGLLRLDAAALSEPLALLYRHLDPDDLEDADELLEVIESLEPPATLEAAIEEMVRAVLLLADVSRPLPSAARSARAPRRPTRRGVRS